MEVKETSVGGIVYRLENEQIYYLLLRQSTNLLWEFPKGNIQRGESQIECAKREMFEEAGIKPILREGFREEIEYINKEKGKSWLKKEIFYLFESNTRKVNLSWEHKDYEWVLLKEALKRLNFKNIREILKKADNKIISQEEILAKKFDKAILKFKEKIMKSRKITCLFVTGSYFRKKLKTDSDLDIFLVTPLSTKREKGIYLIDDIKVSYFINPINKVYSLLLEEKNQQKRPTSEMIYFSKSFLNNAKSKELKLLAKSSLSNKLPKKSSDEISYYSWKLFDKFNSYKSERKNNKIKYKFLEIDIFNFSIEIFLEVLKREYIPHTKYILEKIYSLDKKFYRLITSYLENTDKNLDKVIIYLLSKLKFNKKEYSQESEI